MQKINSDTFVKIIRGDYYQTQDEYNKFYVQGDYSNEIQVFIDDIEISGLVRINEDFDYPYYVKIENSTFLNRIDFYKGKFDKGISFRDTKFLDRVYFTSGKFLWLHFAKCNFSDLLAFGGISDPGNFGSVTVEDVSAKSVGAFGGHFKSLSFKGKSAKHIGVYNTGTFINNLSFSNILEDSTISVSNVSINQLFLSGKYYINNTIEIENIDINSLRLHGFTNKGRFLLNNIKVHEKKKKISDITISDFYKLKNITEVQKSKFQSYTPNIIDESLPLYKLHLALDDNFLNEKHKLLLVDESDKRDSYFELQKASLGELEMKNVEMSNFIKLSIVNSDLSTIKLFNSTFPCNKIDGNYKERYEIFNDLYTVSLKQNNKRDQIEYYKSSKKALLYSMFNRHWFKNIPSIISLGLSLVYSDFGTKWLHAFFVVTPLLGALFFCLMMISTKYQVDMSINGIENFKNLLVYYVRFLNPTHSLEFMDNIFRDFKFSENLLFVVFDTFGRIFISIGLFETIQSFRSYSRK